MTHSLDQIFQAVNSGQTLPPVENTEAPLLRRHHGFAMALQELKQRFDAADPGQRLVERLRVEVVPRQRPVRDIDRRSTTLSAYARKLVELAPQHKHFSEFQVQGWSAIQQAITDKAALVLLAPTGSGKTEVFLLPIVEAVSASLTKPHEHEQHFLMIYPRVELLRDQLSRLMFTIYHAEKKRFGGEHRIILGMQFGGVASTTRATLGNRETFDERGRFLKVSTCPVCKKSGLHHKKYEKLDYLVCESRSCDAKWMVSLSKESHRDPHRVPHLMVTTAESLDRFYLDPQFEPYLKKIDGLALDEAHLYYGVYGAHIHNVFQRFDRLRENRPLAKITSSATIVEPEQFIAKLLGVTSPETVRVHDASDSRMEPSGNEYAYFIQATDNSKTGITRQNPALIQTIMLLGHGLLRKNERILAFVDSVDQTSRFGKTIKDAEVRRHLWTLRASDAMAYNGDDGPCGNAETCEIFKSGECWRGLHQPDCRAPIPGFRDANMHINQVSRKHQNDFMQGDVVIATPVLEVGVDDERILATVHYQAPISGVHGFIQRRGRAGRRADDDAYTVMVLGQSPTEQYYFYRRHRLLHGKYMLPLNPENTVIREIHRQLEEARNAIAQDMRRGCGIQQALHRWAIQKLRSCRLLQELYPEVLAALAPGQGFAKQLRLWREQEQPQLRQHLQLRTMIREIRENVPDHPKVGPIINAALEALNAYERGENSADDVLDKLTAATVLLTPMVIKGEAIDGVPAKVFRENIEALGQSLRPSDLRLAFAEQLHDFFDKIQEFDDGQGTRKGWKLNSVSDVIKTVLQALYFLHLGPVRAHEGTCPVAIEVLVPDAYFGETKLVVVEGRGGSQSLVESVKAAENINFLASILLPYGLTSRYFKSGEYLGTIDVSPQGVAQRGSDDVPEVTLDLVAQGIQRDHTLEPQKVQVRPLQASTEGTDAVRMCLVCFRLYGISTNKQCHDHDLTPVKVYPRPLVYHDYTKPQDQYRFSTLFSFADELRSKTVVEGSEVSFVHCYPVTDDEGTRYNVGKTRGEFRARYAKPLSYGIVTTGIIWKADRLVKKLLANAKLKERVERIKVDGKPQVFDEALILNTAGNMLVRAIIAIAGVNAGNLGFKAKPEDLELCVWETIEGGTGIAQVFMNTLRADPFEVYREFLSSALCPVYIAESYPKMSRADLAQKLTAAWHLQPGDKQLEGLLDDVASEQAAIAAGADRETRTCSEHDGCPACVQSTEGARRRSGTQRASHLVAVAIAHSLLRKVDQATLETMMLSAAQAEQVPPQQLTLAAEDGTLRVLVL